MSLKNRMILSSFAAERPNFIKLEAVVAELLTRSAKSSGIRVDSIEHRVKSESSLEGKLLKKGDSYNSLEDITDLLGARIICYFSDDVDRMGSLVEEMFVIDRENSSDKRSLHKADSFGYLSLHYICSLPEGRGYPEELLGKKFEIQIRTILQHAWAAINHDLGYKTEFGVPREVVRAFARLAGLLEIADDEFVRTRDLINNYTETTREKIIGDDAGDVNVDIISLREYMQRNKRMRKFLERLSDIEGSEITETQPDSYIPQLKWLKIDTIGALQDMLEENEELAFSLAKRALSGTELDILASGAALRFICQAELLRRGVPESEAVEFVMLSVKDKIRAEKQVKRLFSAYDKIKAEH